MPTRKQWLWLEIVSVGAYVWYCYSMSRLASSGDEPEMTEAAFWRWAANASYRMAHRLGSFGIKAETRYNQLIDAERMN